MYFGSTKGVKLGKMFKQNIASVANTANKKNYKMKSWRYVWTQILSTNTHILCGIEEALGLDNRAILDAFLAFFVLLIGDWRKFSKNLRSKFHEHQLFTMKWDKIKRKFFMFLV